MLYIPSELAYFERRNKGPLVIQHFDSPHRDESKAQILDEDWQDYLKHINTKQCYNKITAPDWGPSKGFNRQGKLIFNALVYPGRNVVNITRIDDGWGALETLPMDRLPKCSIYDMPHLIHQVYGYDGKRYFNLANSPNVPLIGAEQRWIDMKWLTPLPSSRVVKVTALPWINIREQPTTASAVAGSYVYGRRVTVYGVEVGRGGLWGRVDSGWIALRYNGKNLTDWKI
jgi:hypothetical protein